MIRGWAPIFPRCHWLHEPQRISDQTGVPFVLGEAGDLKPEEDPRCPTANLRKYPCECEEFLILTPNKIGTSFDIAVITPDRRPR